MVRFHLFTKKDDYITRVRWFFKDWDYSIASCTENVLKFPATPPTVVNKTWEVTVTPEDIKIKCNTLEVLHFIFNNTYNSYCNTRVKGEKATKVLFWSTDTATKMFASLLVGK